MPRLALKYWAGVTEATYQPININQFPKEKEIMGDNKTNHKAKTRPQPPNNTPCNKQRRNIIRRKATQNTPQSQKKDPKQRRNPRPDLANHSSVRHRQQRDTSRTQRAHERERRGRVALLRYQCCLHDAPGVGGADEPPCHDCAGGNEDPAVAAVGDFGVCY